MYNFKHFDIVKTDSFGEQFEMSVVFRLPNQNGIYLLPFYGNRGFVRLFIDFLDETLLDIDVVPQQLIADKYGHFYLGELLKSTGYSLFLKLIKDKNYWLLADGSLPVDKKQSNLSVFSHLKVVDDEVVEQLFLSDQNDKYFKNLDFKYSYHYFDIDFVIKVFNLIKNYEQHK